MKNQFFPLALAATFLMSCASSAPGFPGNEDETRSASGTRADGAQIVSGIEGHEWKLVEVYIDGSNTGFNRDTLPAEPDNFFTLNFDAQNVSGVGVPNRYSAPYAKGDTANEKTLKIMLMRSTMMASFFVPEKLTEHDFFAYMQNAYEWKLVNEKLELLSKTESGSEVKLVFSLEN